MRLNKYFWREQALFSNYSECASIALSNTWYIFWVRISCFIQTPCKSHALCYVIMFSASGFTIFFHIIWKRQNFQKSYWTEIEFFMLPTNWFRNVSFLRRIRRYFIMNIYIYTYMCVCVCVCVHLKYLLFVSR